MAGYSGTPLAKKLGVKEGSHIVVAGAPPYYFSLLEPLPARVHFSSRMTDVTDIVHVFSTRRAELQGMLSRYRQTLKPTGMVWVSWPKKAAKTSTATLPKTLFERSPCRWDLSMSRSVPSMTYGRG